LVMLMQSYPLKVGADPTAKDEMGGHPSIEEEHIPQ